MGHGSVGARGTVVVLTVVALEVAAAFTFVVTATTAGAEKICSAILSYRKTNNKKANVSKKRCTLDQNLI